MKALIALSLFFSLSLSAQTTPPSAPPAPPPACQSEEYRQFDFWIGEWTVTQNGQPAGKNSIKPVDNDCALSENWVSAAGNFTGRSLNSYDRTTGKWHQTWVDSSGTLLLLNGGLKDGSMVLSGQVKGADGTTSTNRITWTPNNDGSVRQHWQVSADGNSWVTAFDGLYVKTGN